MATATADLKITAIDSHSWSCLSGDKTYRIITHSSRLGLYRCDCPARTECKHIKAVKELKTAAAETITPKPSNKGFRRSILEILNDFQQPIPTRFIKTKTLKGQKISFVSWYSYIKLLDYYAPGFGWEVRTKQVGERTVVEGRLTILALEGDFVREATGTEDNDLESWGDPSSNSEAMALRRCCAKFGLGLALWGT